MLLANKGEKHKCNRPCDSPSAPEPNKWFILMDPEMLQAKVTEGQKGASAIRYIKNIQFIGASKHMINILVSPILGW